MEWTPEAVRAALWITAMRRHRAMLRGDWQRCQALKNWEDRLLDMPGEGGRATALVRTH